MIRSIYNMKKLSIALVSLTLLATSPFAQKKPIPIVELKTSGLMGGVQNGKWIAPDKMASKMEASTEFMLVGWNGVEEGGVSLAKRGETEDVCKDFFRIEFELEQDFGIAIGTNARWDPVPRKPQSISLSDTTYKAIVGNFLKTKGILKPVVKLTQAYRVDLEGDGKEEVLLTATYYKNGLSASAAAGDYSVIVLRKIVGSKVVNYEIEGEYVKKNVGFGAPNEFSISTIADLNGDGKMEIVTYAEYYEGSSSGAVEIKNGKPVTIKEFAIGCGV